MTETGSQSELLDQIASSLRELVQLTRVMSYAAIREILETALDTEQKKMVYDALDGTRSTTEIQMLTGVNARYVSEWGREWEKIGIVEPSMASRIRGRRQKSFELALFGIPIPELTTEAVNENTD